MITVCIALYRQGCLRAPIQILQLGPWAMVLRTLSRSLEVMSLGFTVSRRESIKAALETQRDGPAVNTLPLPHRPACPIRFPSRR